MLVRERSEAMQGILSAEEVAGRLDCYGKFNRQDRICVAHCALNISCAISKAKYAGFHAYDDEDTVFLKSPEVDY
jgi:hypothetical protein